MDGTTRQYTLTGLQESSNYTVTVVAVNGAGRSEESSENVVTMADGMYLTTIVWKFVYCNAEKSSIMSLMQVS